MYKKMKSKREREKKEMFPQNINKVGRGKV